MAAMASSAVASGVQRLLFAVQASSAGDPAWLHYIQILGAPGVAIVAAWIAWRIQRQQVAISRGALKTADNKLRLDLYERRFAIVEAAMDLIADRYLKDGDDSMDGDYNRLSELLTRISFANWLFDEKVDLFVSMIAGEANERYKGLAARRERQQQTWKEIGWHITDEERENRRRAEKQARQLVELVAPYMAIKH